MKNSRKTMVIQRLLKLKRRIKIDTQRMRRKALKNLEELFGLAVHLQKGRSSSI